MLVRFSFLFLACLLQFSSFAGTVSHPDLTEHTKQSAYKQHFLDAAERNIFHSLEKNTHRIVVISAKKYSKRFTGSEAAAAASSQPYFYYRQTRILSGLRCRNTPLFLFLRNFRT